MKINKKHITAGVLLVVFIIGIVFTTKYITFLEEVNAKTKIELEKAQQPSEIEIKQGELHDLEEDWRSHEAHIEAVREELRGDIEAKEATEQEIKEKREEIKNILGL